jgi:hypothetical protein
MEHHADPRAIRSTIIGAKSMVNGVEVDVDDGLVGSDIVAMAVVRIRKTDVAVPVLQPGIAELLTAFEQEARAADLRGRLLEQLDHRSTPPSQPNEKLVFDMYGAAGAAVTAVKTGLEAIANRDLSGMFLVSPRPVIDGTPVDLDKEMKLSIFERLEDRVPKLLAGDGHVVSGIPTQQSWWPGLKTASGLADLVRHGVHEPTKKRGLSGRRSLGERFCRGEEAGCAAAMLSAIDFYWPRLVQPNIRAVVVEIRAGSRA